MKTPLLVALTLLAGLLLAGCGQSGAHPAAAAEPTPAATFKSGRGLQLSPAAAAFIGLRSAEVSTRDVGPSKGVTAIPADALLRTAKGDFVWVGNGGWFLRTPVKLGPSEAGWVAVTEGLYDGDSVVIHGVRALWLAEIQAVNGGVGCADGH
jgi:multidrug efflux pump subunit AcrA (membrane-fusion protein)